MSQHQIQQIQQIFASRLETLDHILDVGEKHFRGNETAFIGKRLAPDMLPFGTQIAFACNQPRGFAQWLAGEEVSNLDADVPSLAMARSHIRQTRERVSAIDADDSRLDQVKRVGLGQGMYVELPGQQYVSDFLMPNLYFHMTTAYAILRSLGAPLGKADFMGYLMPLVKREG